MTHCNSDRTICYSFTCIIVEDLAAKAYQHDFFSEKNKAFMYVDI